MAGKGSKVRKTSSPKKYSDGWDRIFGDNTPSQEAIEIISTVHREDADVSSIRKVQKHRDS